MTDKYKFDGIDKWSLEGAKQMLNLEQLIASIQGRAYAISQEELVEEANRLAEEFGDKETYVAFKQRLMRPAFWALLNQRPHHGIE